MFVVFFGCIGKIPRKTDNPDFSQKKLRVENNLKIQLTFLAYNVCVECGWKSFALENVGRR